MKLKIVLEPSEDGGFTVYVPSLPGCISEGDTREEALINIKEAIALYLELTEDDHIQDNKSEMELPFEPKEEEELVKIEV
jgi:predicted RNase H-like HicB family nuclease